MYKKEQVPAYVYYGRKKLPASFTTFDILNSKLAMIDKIRIIGYLHQNDLWYKVCVKQIFLKLVEEYLCQNNWTALFAVSRGLKILANQNEFSYNMFYYVPQNMRKLVLTMLTIAYREEENV